MNAIRAIRQRLSVTQSGLAQAIGVTQPNVSLYERGQTIPPDVARRLIDYAATLGVTLRYDDIYAPELQQKEGEHE